MPGSLKVDEQELEHRLKIKAGIKFYRSFISGEKKYNSSIFMASWPKFVNIVEAYIDKKFGEYGPDVKKNPSSTQIPLSEQPKSSSESEPKQPPQKAKKE